MPFDVQINFDFSWITTIGSMPLYAMLWFFFIKGGWVLFALVIIWGLFELFVYNNQCKFAAKIKTVCLAVDIPKQNLQTAKAMENFFATVAGAHTPIEWEDAIFEGAFQIGFSFEIVSLGGHIQYIVRTPVQWRAMIESAIFAQYPDAEITEVEDYAKAVEVKFPSDEYNIWGADLTLYNKGYFPIKCYTEFEHAISKDTKDPMSSLLEVMSKLRPGEQFWYQILVYPTDTAWTKESENALKKMMGQPIEVKRSTVDKVMEAPLGFLTDAANVMFGAVFGPDAPPEKKDQKAMMFLPPKEKVQAEAIVRKMAKIGFNCKLRIVYFGKREVFNKGLGVSGTFGAIKQFSDLTLNGFKPDKNKTQARWPWFKQLRLSGTQNRILAAYKSRAADTGSPRFILNIEELATLWHFPFYEIKSPLGVKKIESKKVEAPVGLPIGDTASIAYGKKTTSKLPSVEPVVDYDDDFFEQHFAKDKTGQADREHKEQVVQELVDRGALDQDRQVSVTPAPVDSFAMQFNKETVAEEKPEVTGSDDVDRLAPPPNLPIAN